MRKRNLWKAAGIMAAGVLTVSMAGGEAVRVYAGETKIAASADRETEKEKSEKSKTVTPVLLLDKDGKPVIGPDGKPVYVTPTPAKENELKNAQDADAKEDASAVPAGEGQPVPAEGAVSAAVEDPADADEAANAMPVPVPDAAESAAALHEMEAEASGEEYSGGQEEIPAEVSSDVTAEEPAAESIAAPAGQEETEDSYAAENAAGEETAEQNTDAPSETASTEYVSDATETPDAADTSSEDDRSAQASEETSSENAEKPSDAVMPAADPAGTASDTADAAESSSDSANRTESASDSAASGEAEQVKENSKTSVKVTSVRDLFATAVIPAATEYNAEEETPSLSASLIGASAGEEAEGSADAEEKEHVESTSAPSEDTDDKSASAAADTEDASREVPSGIPELVVYEIEAVTEELAGPGTNQLVGNTDAVGTKTVTADQGSGTTGGYSGSASYTSSASSSSGSGSSGTSWQNSSAGTAVTRTANPKTGDTQKARVYFGTSFASLAAIVKVMLETERAKRKIRK